MAMRFLPHTREIKYKIVDCIKIFRHNNNFNNKVFKFKTKAKHKLSKTSRANLSISKRLNKKHKVIFLKYK